MFNNAFFRIVRTARMMAVLDRINDNAWKQVEDSFGSVSGGQRAGLDVPTRIIRVDNSPELVTKERLSEVFHDLGSSVRYIDWIEPD
jgi:hypothetical protein